MKKYTLLFLFFICFSTNIRAQDSSYIKNLRYFTDCGGQKNNVLGAYDDVQRALTDKNIAIITGKLNILLNCKDIEASRLNSISEDAWLMLMRIHDIEWTAHKTEILNYLSIFMKKVLDGNSFLDKNTRNILYNEKGCHLDDGDPITIPFACYWAALKIDSSFAIKMLNDSWSQIQEDEPFYNDLRGRLVFWINQYYKRKDTDISLLVEKFEKTNIEERGMQHIKRMKYKSVIFEGQNQSEVWTQLFKLSPTESNAALFNSDNIRIWSDALSILKENFGNIDVTIPVALAEQEKDVKKKYFMGAACCWLVNRNYHNKEDKTLITRIHKLVADIEVESVDLPKKTNKGADYDYLKTAYQTVKKTYKK